MITNNKTEKMNNKEFDKLKTLLRQWCAGGEGDRSVCLVMSEVPRDIDEKEIESTTSLFSTGNVLASVTGFGTVLKDKPETAFCIATAVAMEMQELGISGIEDYIANISENVKSTNYKIND